MLFKKKISIKLLNLIFIGHINYRRRLLHSLRDESDEQVESRRTHTIRLFFDSANFAVVTFTCITAYKQNLCRAIWLPRYKLDADVQTRTTRRGHTSHGSPTGFLVFANSFVLLFSLSLFCCIHLSVSISPSQDPWLINDINCTVYIYFIIHFISIFIQKKYGIILKILWFI